uniref:Uncharacterized protein n=1 Tax=Arundo donax TaxID=35708 RepID=A0A0A8XYT5_ARUDO
MPNTCLASLDTLIYQYRNNNDDDHVVFIS